MIIGNGLLATEFKEYKNNLDIIIFASGVSNSRNVNIHNFIREEKLLLNTISNNQNKKIVYFSSCDVIYANELKSGYYFHKLKMESLIKNSNIKYNILRLPQVISNSKNKYSLVNFFVNSIKKNKELIIYKNAVKNLIFIGDIKIMSKIVIENNEYLNTTINIINKNYYTIIEILICMEELLGKKAIIRLVDKGCPVKYKYININDKADINFDNEYLKKSLSKIINEL
jgi:UDP-2-acetamido-2,6-beta-L-arabino-hexul-4-ose reductase